MKILDRLQDKPIIVLYLAGVLLAGVVGWCGYLNYRYPQGVVDGYTDDTIALSKAMERTVMETMGTQLDRYWDHDTGVACYVLPNGKPLGCAYTPTQFVDSAEREAFERSTTDYRWSRQFDPEHDQVTP